MAQMEELPGALLALDTYPKQTFDRQHQLAALAMRGRLPGRYRYLPLADPVLGKTMAITLFRASSPAAAG